MGRVVQAEPKGEWKFFGRGPEEVSVPCINGLSCQGHFKGISTST